MLDSLHYFEDAQQFREGDIIELMRDSGIEFLPFFLIALRYIHHILIMIVSPVAGLIQR